MIICKQAVRVVAVTLLAFILTQCNNGTGKLQGKWQINRVEINGIAFKGDWYWKFDGNKYTAHMPGTVEKGTFTVEADKLSLQSSANDTLPQTVYDIVKLDSANLILGSQTKGNSMVIAFTKQ